MSGEVFIDSGAFIAYLVRADRLHQETVALFAEPPAGWCTSTLVVAESYGWFLHRIGEDAGRTFRQLLSELPALTVLDTDGNHRAATGRKLDVMRGLRLTYVDASSLVWIQTRKIKRVWGTDHHLGIEGAEVVPGPPIR